jgi:hypothetical protein
MLESGHSEFREYKQRMSVKQWKEILLANKDSIIFRGIVRPLKAKSLGYGVVEVSKDFSDRN